jgi:hypothetical protein
MELSFISPIVGERYIDKIKDIVYDIGWNIGIANSVNQNEIISMAKELCNKNDIFLNKTFDFSLEISINI